jgi:hypothetical protein
MNRRSGMRQRARLRQPRVNLPAPERRSDDGSRWLVGRRPSQSRALGLVERIKGSRFGLVNRQAGRRLSVLQHLGCADRKQRTILAVALLLLLGTARHVARHIRHLHAGVGRSMPGHQTRRERGDRQSDRDQRGEKETQEPCHGHWKQYSHNRTVTESPLSSLLRARKRR